MKIIEELISPITLKQFSEAYLFRKPYAAPFKANRFQGLVSWPKLESIFLQGHNDCWLPRYGQLPLNEGLASGVLTAEQARQAYKEGRTVLVRHAEKADSELAGIAEDFYKTFGRPVDIQVYCTPRGEEGFNWHYDLEEVFVLQCRGEKEFYLKPNTVTSKPLPKPLPKDLQFEKEHSKIEIRCLLKAGDWLYIPSGYWHKARAVTDSFHISIGVMACPQ